VQAVIKDTITHEVGHTLGLKHNFKASTVVTRAQLQDKGFTEAKGISGSVMDYNAYNLAARGEKQGALNNTTLGPYDYWAIEYAYRQSLPADPGRSGRGRAQAHRRARHRPAAGLCRRQRDRRQPRQRRHRSAGEPFRSRRRPAGLLRQAAAAVA
jgi:hypothetical protein